MISDTDLDIVAALHLLWNVQKQRMTLSDRLVLWNAANHLYRKLTPEGRQYWHQD